MENASKALIMAGGILIALLVLGALLLMFNELSAYQRSKSDLTKVSQLSEFNYQFTQYARNDLSGFDLISLVNKVVDYNLRTGGYGEINYDKKITLNITITDAFEVKYGKKEYTTNLNKFKVGTYTVKNITDYFYKTASEFAQYEYIYTLDVITTMVSNRTSILNGEKKTEEFTNDKLPFKDLTGRVLDNNQVVKFLDEYSEYSLLKSSTFRMLSEPVYDGDQISSMSFQYLK